LLYLIVNLLVVVFERTHNEIHVLVNFSAVHSRGVELTETFQVEHITFVYDFEELFGLWSLIFLMNFFISGYKLKFVSLADNLGSLCCFHGTFGKMTRLVVEQTMRVSAPGYPLHQNHMASECALFKFHFYLASISILEV
jgi:hypothetical protein